MQTICYLVRPCSGGMQKHVMELIAHFRNHFRIVLVASGGSGIATEAKCLGIEVYELPLTENISVVRDISTLKGLLSVLRRERPALLHVHGFKVSLWGRLAGRIMDIPVVVTVHNYPAYPVSGEVLPRLFRAVENYQGDWAYKYITVSQSLAGYLKQNTEIPADKIEVIYNGINTVPFELAQQGNLPFCSKTCLDFIKKEGVTLVGTLARLAPQKGLGHFIRSAAILVPRFPQIKFVIIGDGPMRRSLENMVHKLNLKGKVFFTGHMKDIPAVMSMLDVFVLPSNSEGLSLTLLEALAAARPVVASRTGGIPEIIIHNKTGKLITPGDGRALAEAVEQLLLNPEEAVKLASAGQARIKELFSRDEMIKRTGKIYKDLAGEKAELEVSSAK